MHKHDLILKFLKSTDFVKVAVASCEVCKYRGDYDSANKWFSVAASLMSQSEMYLEGGIDYYGLLTLEMVAENGFDKLTSCIPITLLSEKFYGILGNLRQQARIIHNRDISDGYWDTVEIPDINKFKCLSVFEKNVLCLR